MPNLLTKDDVYQPQFLKMPHDFFYGEKYSDMRLESKAAYMLLLNQLSLSIKNDWVNELGQVYVKLSRKNLMALLGIKGTQKIAQVMRELEDHKLVFNKRMGLNRCNQIYLYPVVGQVIEKRELEPVVAEEKNYDKVVAAEVAVETMASVIHEVPRTSSPAIPLPVASPIAPASVSDPLDTEFALAEVQDLLENKIHTEDLKQKYDPGFIDEICRNIRDMFLSKTTRIGKQDKPQVIMRGVLRELKMHHIEHVVDQFMAVASKTEIFNPKRYLQAMIYNSVHEADTRLMGRMCHDFRAWGQTPITLEW